MGLINIFNTLDNTHNEKRANGKIKEIFPEIDFSNCLFLKAGERLTPDYEVKPEDIIYLRVTPGAITATTAAIIGITAVVVATGAAIGGALIYKNNKDVKEAQEKAQRNANNLAQQVDQLPFLKGSKNQKAIGNLIPLQLGKMYNTPSYLTDVFYSIGGTNGENQYINGVLSLGYGAKRIEKILIGEEVILENSSGITSGIHSFKSDSIYYDSSNFVEIRYEEEEFTTESFNKKVVTVEDGEELAHEFNAPTDPDDPDSNGGTPLIKQLPDNVKRLEVCINFNGLRSYNMNTENWESRTATVKPFWSNDGGDTWHEFYFTGMTNNSITINSNKTIRFIAVKEFSAAESFNKNILLKVVKTTPKQESNSNEDAYLTYYQVETYDAKNSTSTNLVTCKNINTDLLNKIVKIAFRIKSNVNINGQLENFHAITTTKARTWDGKEWSQGKTATRNPASMILEVLTSDLHTFSKYEDEEIDLEALGYLYEYCELNNFNTDVLITQSIKKRDIISNILKTISADMIINEDGLLSFVIDKAEELPVALLNAENIKSITYSKDFTRRPDGVKVTYTDGEKWQVDNFYSMLDGGEKGQDDITTELNLEYVTDYQHAYKIAQKAQRQLKYQNRLFSVGVGKEGDYYPLYSTVLFQHKEFKKKTKSSTIAEIYRNEFNFIDSLRINDLIKFEDGKTYGVIIQAVTAQGSRVIYRNIDDTRTTGKTNLITLQTPIMSGIMPDLFNVVSIGELNDNGEFVLVADVMKITGITPDGNEGFILELKDYNEEIYDFGVIPEHKSNITPPPAPKASAETGITKAELLEAEVEAVKTATTAAAKVQPKYIGPFASAPDLDLYGAGDYYLNTTNGLTYTKTLGAWAEDTGATLTQHLAACMNDLLAIADTLENEPTFIKNLVAANVFLNNLFAKKITLQTGGEIVSSNFYNEQGEETGNGFKIDYNGDIKANNGFFKGYLGERLTLIENGSEYIHAPTYNANGRNVHWELYAQGSASEIYVGYLDFFEYSSEEQVYCSATGKLFDLSELTFYDISYYSDYSERRIDTFKIKYHSLYKDFSPDIRETLYAYQTIGGK